MPTSKKPDETKIDRKTGAPRDSATAAEMDKAHGKYSATEGKEATHDTPADHANGRK